jgi:hypothetical protein
MFFMDNDTKQVRKPVSVRRRLAPWIGGIVLGAMLTVFGQIYYNLAIVGRYKYYALEFIERDFVRPHPSYSVYINDAPAPVDIVVMLSDGLFGRILFSGPVYAASPRAVYRLVPRSDLAGFREYRFEIDAKKGECHAQFEIRGIEPVFVGCSERRFRSD